ncbi:hypothetical protein BDY21DRAFT_369260 [Lineolata rhizophorae]|uniref:Tetratricopeptide repeat protein 1 n=1 Tax=Lineolata rhizophorae TaxID=578093 RepID=A0A6A6PB77_9PEZI|nr:hypothetical protein BDY21DRAFT_369260 [Lineolata rhizophorae]
MATSKEPAGNSSESDIPPRFDPAEEAELLVQSNARKSDANSLFGHAAYDEAIQAYDKALASCPNYLEYEVAVLRANVAACHIKLADWKAAVESATQALDGLDRLDPPPKTPASGGESGSGVIEEVDDEAAEAIERLVKSGKSHEDVAKIRAKALLRRAKAREELGGWAALQGADEDYRALSQMRNLAPLDQKAVQRALASLSARLEAAKQQEIGEMMGKLKQLGNGILKPFGLSTDNFNFIKDENTGGYSMQFDQNR